MNCGQEVITCLPQTHIREKQIAQSSVLLFMIYIWNVHSFSEEPLASDFPGALQWLLRLDSTFHNTFLNTHKQTGTVLHPKLVNVCVYLCALSDNQLQSTNSCKQLRQTIKHIKSFGGEAYYTLRKCTSPVIFYARFFS